MISNIILENGEEYREIISQYYNKLSKIFNEDIGPVKIIIEHDEKRFQDKIGLNAPKFIVGFARELEDITLISKDKFPSRGHKIEEFEQVIFHEMAHIFFRRITKRPVFPWIEEGFCEYLSFPENHKLKEFIDLTKIRTAKEWYSCCPYNQSKKFVKFLIDKSGLGNFLRFIKLLNKKEEEVAFIEVFKNNIENLQEEFKNEETIPPRHPM